ncbi:hypothetical protein POTOM_005820 [Populus tomentosa]|uniref:Uncharacterized protein n=1 Tax=Populus tomentosa TaxID=118781 RepID=A0A8X8AMS2_POPTO|nr:hypothetical protein POTOM_005820 [Populus tomentosa]
MEEGSKMVGYDITSVSQVMEMKPGFSPLLTTIKYSMDTSGSDELDETYNKFIPLEEFTPASIKANKSDDDQNAITITLTKQQDKDMKSDPSLILYSRHMGSPNSLDNSNTTYKTFCLFPEIKETHKLQTKNQQLHAASH